MGARHSGHPRTLHLDNNNPTGVIDVSDDVVQRLKNGMIRAESPKRSSDESTKSESTKSSSSSGSTSLSSSKQKATSFKPSFSTSDDILNTKENIPSTFPNPYGPPRGMYAEPTITASDVRREKDKELHENDAYWRKRLIQLEQNLNQTNAVMEKEYSLAIDSVRKKFQNVAPSHQLAPCQDLKAQLIACYRANPGETLKCHEEAEAFIDCAHRNRLKKLDSMNTDDNSNAAGATKITATESSSDNKKSSGKKN